MLSVGDHVLARIDAQNVEAGRGQGGVHQADAGTLAQAADEIGHARRALPEQPDPTQQVAVLAGNGSHLGAGTAEQRGVHVAAEAAQHGAVQVAEALRERLDRLAAEHVGDALDQLVGYARDRRYHHAHALAASRVADDACDGADASGVAERGAAELEDFHGCRAPEVGHASLWPRAAEEPPIIWPTTRPNG